MLRFKQSFSLIHSFAYTNLTANIAAIVCILCSNTKVPLGSIFFISTKTLKNDPDERDCFITGYYTMEPSGTIMIYRIFIIQLPPYRLFFAAALFAAEAAHHFLQSAEHGCPLCQRALM